MSTVDELVQLARTRQRISKEAVIAESKYLFDLTSTPQAANLSSQQEE